MVTRMKNETLVLHIHMMSVQEILKLNSFLAKRGCISFSIEVAKYACILSLLPKVFFKQVQVQIEIENIKPFSFGDIQSEKRAS